MAAPRTIERFGRTYVEFDPDGAGGGPSTWVLSSGGGGSGSGSSGSTSGTFLPGDSAAICNTGSPLYFIATSQLDLALGVDALPGAPAGAAAPYLVCGLAAENATSGQLVGVITDGQVSRTDWSQVCGSVDLIAGARYYLSVTTPGMLQLACPSTPGNWVVCAGQAVSARALDVEIDYIARI